MALEHQNRSRSARPLIFTAERKKKCNDEEDFGDDSSTPRHDVDKSDKYIVNSQDVGQEQIDKYLDILTPKKTLVIDAGEANALRAKPARPGYSSPYSQVKKQTVTNVKRELNKSSNMKSYEILHSIKQKREK